MRKPCKLYLLGSVISILTAGCAGLVSQPGQALSVNPADVNFKSVAINSTGAAQSLALVNSGSDSVTVTSASSTAPQFALAGLTLPVTLQPSETRTIQATFSPASAQAYTGTLSFQYNRSTGSGTAQVAVSGEGTAAPPASNAVASPSSINYGSVNVGSTSTTTFVVTNENSATLTISSFSSSGVAFQVTGPTTPVSVATYQSETFTVVFQPTAAGPANATITVNSNAADSPSQVAVSGVGISTSAAPAPTPPPTQPTGSVPPLNPSATNVSFGNVTVGNNSTLPVTFSNVGTSNVTISSSTVSGAGFTATGVSAGQVIASGQSATMNVTFAPAATGTASGNVTVASDASDASITVAFAGTGMAAATAPAVVGAPACGKSDDTSIHIPSDWANFVPPAKGQSYVDSTFGCTVTRITDSSTEDWNGSAYLPITHGYPTISPFNANDTYLMLADGWNEHFVTDLTGNIVVSIANMPTANDTWMLWDLSNPNVFYYTNGNSLMQGTVSGSTVATTTLHQFTEYPAINFMDEADLSQDGAHVVIIGGDNTGSSPENVFDYDFVTNVKGPALTTACTGVINNSNNACLHKLVQTPDNNVMVDFANDGQATEQGLRLWTGAALSDPLSAATTLLPLQDGTNHTDSGEDMNGTGIFVAMGNSVVLPGQINPCPSGWGTDVIQIYNPTLLTCLIDIDQYGSLSNEHVSYKGNSSQPWVNLSFFDDRSPSPEWFDNSANYTAPSSSNWQYLEDEIDLVRIDANNNSQYAYRLAHAYSRSDEDFYATPRASISRDGNYIAFDSNMAFAHTGCVAQAQTSTGCEDVYIIKVH